MRLEDPKALSYTLLHVNLKTIYETGRQNSALLQMKLRLRIQGHVTGIQLRSHIPE